MIQQQILAIPPHVQAEIDGLNALIEVAPDQGALVAMIARRDALLSEREPRPIAIGERF